jgi:hypothetical protein
MTDPSSLAPDRPPPDPEARHAERLRAIAQVAADWPELGEILARPEAERLGHSTILAIARDFKNADW